MYILRFNNKTLREKILDILHNESKKFTVDTDLILNKIEEDEKVEYILDFEEQYIFKNFLNELSSIFPNNYYFIKGGNLGEWCVIEDLSDYSDVYREYGNPITLIKFNKLKNEADIYIRDKSKPDKSLSARDEWRSRTGGID
ncbi:MAG: hypothetical protein IJZ79_03150 [Bacilli bacterium]|nr:hypothetical protein [Bacilli bacterium]MBQ8218724.1 hypothetical protein [Bacilli bacterium]